MHLWPRERGLEKAFFAQAACAAKFGQAFFMQQKQRLLKNPPRARPSFRERFKGVAILLHEFRPV